MKTTTTNEAVPASSPESVDGKLQALHAALEAAAFRLIAKCRAVRAELGLTFMRIKATLPDGRWKSYFAETFGECGIGARTAQRWMDLVHASAKNDTEALFKSAMDPQA